MPLRVDFENTDQVLERAEEFEQEHDLDSSCIGHSVEVSSFADSAEDFTDFDSYLRSKAVVESMSADLDSQSQHDSVKTCVVPLDLRFTHHSIDRDKIESDLNQAQKLLEREGLETEFHMNNVSAVYEDPRIPLTDYENVNIRLAVYGSGTVTTLDYSGDFAPSDEALVIGGEEKLELTRRAYGIVNGSRR